MLTSLLLICWSKILKLGIITSSTVSGINRVNSFFRSRIRILTFKHRIIFRFEIIIFWIFAVKTTIMISVLNGTFTAVSKRTHRFFILYLGTSFKIMIGNFQIFFFFYFLRFFNNLWFFFSNLGFCYAIFLKFIISFSFVYFILHFLLNIPKRFLFFSNVLCRFWIRSFDFLKFNINFKFWIYTLLWSCLIQKTVCYSEALSWWSLLRVWRTRCLEWFSVHFSLWTRIQKLILVLFYVCLFHVSIIL